MLNTVKDPPVMASLLYYFGVLTLAGQGVLGKLILQIPNLVARSLNVERLQELWLPTYEDRSLIQSIADTFYLTGKLQPLGDFIEQRYFKVLSNRDYRWSNELLVKIAFLTLLFNDRLYMMVSQLETDRGYVDLSLIVRLIDMYMFFYNFDDLLACSSVAIRIYGMCHFIVLIFIIY